MIHSGKSRAMSIEEHKTFSKGPCDKCEQRRHNNVASKESRTGCNREKCDLNIGQCVCGNKRSVAVAAFRRATAIIVIDIDCCFSSQKQNELLLKLQKFSPLVCSLPPIFAQLNICSFCVVGRTVLLLPACHPACIVNLSFDDGDDGVGHPIEQRCHNTFAHNNM